MARLIDADKLLTKVVSVSNSIGQVTWSAVSAIDILNEPTVCFRNATVNAVKDTWGL